MRKLFLLAAATVVSFTGVESRAADVETQLGSGAAIPEAIAESNVESSAESSVETTAEKRRRASRRQSGLARELPGTTVIRVEQYSGQVEVAHVRQKLGKAPRSFAAPEELEFIPVDPAALSEPSSGLKPASSWSFYFWGGNWNYPTYYYSGYDFGYNSYYSYPSGRYNYYYFSWPFYF